MSQGNDFANYDSSAADSGSASEDVWFVAVSSDDIKQMSVDQLDEAFRLGLISAQTAVWTEGMEAWAPLGEVADLDSDESSSADPEPAAEPVFASPAYSAPAYSAPAYAEPSSSVVNAMSMRSHEQTWRNPFDAPAASASTQQSSVSHHPSMGPSSFAPVTASYAPPSPGLQQSTGPVALNVDEDMPPVNRGRSWRPERWLLAAAGVAAIGVIAFNNSDLFSSGSSAAAEKQASAASLAPRPYEAPAEKGSTVLAAAKLDDGKDAPIGSLVPAARADEEDGSDKAAEPAAAPPSSLTPPSKIVASTKESVRGGMSKAFSGKKASAKPAKARATKARKPPSRASKSKKSSVARASSAFDPLNGSLP